MPTATEQPRTPVPPALTLAVASVLLTAGAVGLLRQDAGGPPPDHVPMPDVRMRDQSPVLAAETYLDAWRKRRFDLAMRVSRGRAHRQARTRLKSPGHAPTRPEAGATAEIERPTYLVDETHYEGDSRVHLFGVAEGHARDAPYRRRAAFTVERSEGRWQVSSMTLGAVLQNAPQAPHDGP